MPSTDVAFAIKDNETPSAAMARAKNPTERMLAAKYGMELQQVPGVRAGVPRFMLELPWDTNNEGVVEDILTNLLAANDLEAATQESEVAKPKDLLGQAVTIRSLVVKPSDIEDASWGAYLLLQVETAELGVIPVATGSAQVVATVYRLYTEGKLPAVGTFVALGKPKVGRDQPIGFRLEAPL